MCPKNNQPNLLQRKAQDCSSADEKKQAETNKQPQNQAEECHFLEGRLSFTNAAPGQWKRESSAF